jgi:fibronectin-binding autotransporter adhesin
MKHIILAFLMLLYSAMQVATAQIGVLPTGYIGAIQCCNTPGQYSTYTYSFTPTQTGSDYVLFAFRQDPAYWSFGNVEVNLAGSNTNLLLNGNMQYGGGVSVPTNNGQQYIQAPTHWGVIYQSGIYPAAAGTWSGSGGPQGVGQWYDGAVGSFDGIYQGISVVAGQTYTVSFQALSTYGVANTSSIQIGAYAGSCANLGLAPANCTPPSNSGWSSLATPADTGTAGGVTVTGTTTTTTISTTTNNGTPIVTTTHPTRTVNTTINGQAVIETFTDTQTSTVTPITTTTYSTPTTVTTYSDGTSVTTTGTPTVTNTSTSNSSPVVVLTQSTTPTSIIPAYSSNISAAEQARYNAANTTRLGMIGNSIDITNSGSNNQVYIAQIGTNQQIGGIGQTAMPILGSNNHITINQGDTITHQGQSLIQASVNGNFNSLNINQGPDSTGFSTGTDQGGHYQSISVNGDSNTVTTSQIGFNNYAEVNVTGNNNTQTLIQNGSNHQAFTAIAGNSNNLSTIQNGNGGHFLDVSLTGGGNGVTVTQSGDTPNRATISITNAGGPAGVNLTQTGGQVFSITQTCVTPTGCGTTTVRQGN